MTNLPPNQIPRHTVKTAAQKFGLDGSQIRRLCVSLEVGEKIGRDWLLSDADFERIAREFAPCDVGLPDIEADVPDEKIMFAMDLCAELSAQHGG